MDEPIDTRERELLNASEMDEPIDTRERELLNAYVAARKLRERLEAKSSAAWKEMMEAQSQLVEFLEDQNKRSTGTYSDLGSLTVTEPIATFKVPDENKEEVLAWVKLIGAVAVIKKTIHHATLQSLFRERLEKNEAIPGWVEVKYVPQVRYNAPKP